MHTNIPSYLYEGSNNFETFQTKNFDPVAQNVMAQDLIRSLAIKNLSCRVKIFSWKCLKIGSKFLVGNVSKFLEASSI